MVRTAQPESEFTVRLVGAGIRPRTVPTRALAQIINAVQRLVEQKDEEGEVTTAEPDIKLDGSKTLHLIRVKRGSAAYALAAGSSDAVKYLSLVGAAIDDPVRANWTEPTLSSLNDLSEVAKSLGCDIEFFGSGRGSQPPEVLARITPQTYREVTSSAFVRGITSIYARLERVGGATKMHCGIRLPAAPNKMVICRVSTDKLIRQLGRYIYENITLTGKATWLRHNWKLHRMTVTGFEPPKRGSILEALQRAHDSGGYAWDDVPDPVVLLGEIRGS